MKKNLKPGFTLIEALAVIVIIGILASLSIYTITQAQRQARDTVRKSDVSAIAQGFEARALDKTCVDQSAVGIYPGESILIADTATNERMSWHKVIEITENNADRCNPLSTYFSTIPSDPKTESNHYYFNLSAKPGSKGQHYRVAAKLEKEPNSEQWKEICRQSDVWFDEFVGSKYAGCGGIINSTGTSSSARSVPSKYSLGILSSLIAAPVAAAPVPCPAFTHGNPNNPNECIPNDEICGDGIDNDGDGQIDENCSEGGGGSNGGSNGGGSNGGGSNNENTEEDNLPYNYYVGR